MIALYLLAVVGAGFLPLFLWNLWLAPYKILSERLDKIADSRGGEDSGAKAAPDARLERGKKEAQQLYKKQDALRDMNTIMEAMSARIDRADVHWQFQGKPTQLDHDFVVLTKKHRSWLLDDLNDAQMNFWVKRIISVLEAHNYDAADRLIKDAVSRGSWKD